jgi:translocation and assembly module TamA
MKKISQILSLAFVLEIILLDFSGFVNAKDIENKKDDSEYKGIDYDFFWEDGLEKSVKQKFKEVSSLINMKKRLSGSFGGLLKRAEEDKKLMLKVLSSFGYFDAEVLIDIDQSKKPLSIKFVIQTGVRYKLKNVVFRATNTIGAFHLNSLKIPYEIMRIAPNDFIEAEKCHSAQEAIKKYCYNHGYPFAIIDEPYARIDNKEKTAEIVYLINPHILAYIEKTDVDDIPDLDSKFVNNRLLWKEKELFDAKKIEKTRLQIMETGVIDSILIAPKDLGIDNGKEPSPIKMHVKAKTGLPRSIGAGIKYASFDGIETNLFWRHYNLRNRGDYLGTGITASKRITKIGLNYDVQDFFAPRQKLANEAYWLKEKTRAYTSNTKVLASYLQRPLGDYLTGSLGISGEVGTAKKNDQNYRNRLLGFPLELIFDASNNLLNPTRGLRANVKFVPYVGNLDKTKGMAIIKGGSSIYLPLYTDVLEEDLLVLAGFARAGVVQIKDFNALPPNKRFYSGGAGSIRGYRYQMLGPLDSNLVPIGGQSLLEVGGEIRFSFSEKFGLVTFLEAGSVDYKKIPTFKNKNIFYSTGLGLRYMTPVGPIRFDIGVPLKRRKDPSTKKYIDPIMQFYVSIGQAF